MFDELTGDLIKGELRSGNVYTSRQVVRFIGPVLKKYVNKYPNVTRVIRGDSGFAVPELYKIAEQLNTLCAIRLKVNHTLYKLSTEFAVNYSAVSSDFNMIKILDMPNRGANFLTPHELAWLYQ